jgi:hypothetical protein
MATKFEVSTPALEKAKISAPDFAQRDNASLFYPHGIWAPGVKLMRQLKFGAKASIICLMFLIPVVLLTFYYFSDKNDLLEFSEKELAGAKLLEMIAPLSDAVGKVRNSSRVGAGNLIDTKQDYVDGRRQVDEAIRKIESSLKENGDSLMLEGDLSKFKSG